MTLTVHDKLVQGSAEWHDVRRGIVTASVVGQLITAKTLKPASNDYSRGLVATLAAERITGYTDPTYMNADMYRGVEDEPIARDAYAKHYAQAVECGFMTRDLGVGILGYSPDALVGTDGLLEIKSRRGKKQVQTVLADQIPPENLAQCQAGLLVSGRAWLDFVSYSGGHALWVKRITPDIRWFEAIVAAVAQFETDVEQVVSDYLAAVDGLPMTERTDLEMVL